MTGELDRGTRRIVWQGVEECLGGDVSGHGIDHIERVHDLSMRFCDHYPSVGREVVSLAAILHDVDDYKLVGREQAHRLQNMGDIMRRASIADDTQTAVRGIVAHMGYSKALRGIRPVTLEGSIVSDADMCDAMGAGGLVRALTYALSDKGSGVVFDKASWPIVDITAQQYNSDNNGTTHSTDSFINHFFEKLLRLPGMMMTDPGKLEAILRNESMISFLRSYFREQNVPEWSKFLERYIADR